MQNGNNPLPRPSSTEPVLEQSFKPILALIRQSQRQALQAVNAALVDLYWRIGEYLTLKIRAGGWGQGTVQDLARWLQNREPGLRGFSAQNLWRMRQFFEAYREDPNLSALLRELPWTHNIIILNKCRGQEERGFYLKTAAKERWGSRELERQIASALFERVVTGRPRHSHSLSALHPDAPSMFRDRYFVEFLGLPETYAEKDLHRGLLLHLRAFLLELGRDFCFVGCEFGIQVGGQVYLEALDRQYRKPHEAPSIGILLCKGQNADVVEYALNRTLSPALVADYETQLPDKTLLRAKLDEFYELMEQEPVMKPPTCS